MNKAYQEKLIDLKEKEAVKEFETCKIKKEIQILGNEYSEYRIQKEAMVQSLKGEIEGLRKLSNAR